MLKIREVTVVTMLDDFDVWYILIALIYSFVESIFLLPLDYFCPLSNFDIEVLAQKFPI